MTPIEKNISVVDEQGNEYEATYPKRAKGLVKNGRARFISENRICLACPPNKNLEDNKMTNTNNTINKVGIYNNIVELQKKLESLHVSLYTVQCVSDKQDYVEQEDRAPITLEFSSEVALEKIKVIREIVMSREKTINTLLDFYLSIYRSIDLDGENTSDSAVITDSKN